MMKRCMPIMIVMLLSVSLMHSRAQGAADFDLEKLFIDVFDQQPGEKVLGMHLASGRSDYIGGNVDVADFSHPVHIIHQDSVYPKDGELQVVSLVLEYSDGTSEGIIQDREYPVFKDRLQIPKRGAYFIWLFLVAAALNYLAWDLGRGTPVLGVVKLSWSLVIMILGPIGLLVYLLSYRKLHLEKAPAGWRWALGASFIRGALFALWLVVIFIIFALFIHEPGPVHILSLTYLLPILISVFVIGAPFIASRNSCGYWSGVCKVVISDFIIQTITFIGMFPTFFFLDQQWQSEKMDVTNPVFWIILSTSTLVGAVVLFPFFNWVLRRGFLNWNLLLSDGKVFVEIESKKVMSLRNSWGLLMLSIILFVCSIGLMVVGMS